jgi:hypothetical protein
MDITVRSLSSKPREAPPEVLFVVCLFRRMALEKPKAKLIRLFRLGDLFQWKATKSSNKQALSEFFGWVWNEIEIRKREGGMWIHTRTRGSLTALIAHSLAIFIARGDNERFPSYKQLSVFFSRPAGLQKKNSIKQHGALTALHLIHHSCLE